MSKVYSGVSVEDRWDRQDDQMSLFVCDGVDPNGKYFGAVYLQGDMSKTGKWNRIPDGWTFFDVMDHGEYFKDLQYLYLSEVGGEGKDKYAVYKY